MRIVIITSLTLLAFAANSILSRLALGGNLIDPVSFATIRLVNGALALAIVSRLTPESKAPKNTGGAWASGFALFAYAIALALIFRMSKLRRGVLERRRRGQCDKMGALQSLESSRSAD